MLTHCLQSVNWRWGNYDARVIIAYLAYEVQGSLSNVRVS